MVVRATTHTSNCAYTQVVKLKGCLLPTQPVPMASPPAAGMLLGIAEAVGAARRAAASAMAAAVGGAEPSPKPDPSPSADAAAMSDSEAAAGSESGTEEEAQGAQKLQGGWHESGSSLGFLWFSIVSAMCDGMCVGGQGSCGTLSNRDAHLLFVRKSHPVN